MCVIDFCFVLHRREWPSRVGLTGKTKGKMKKKSRHRPEEGNGSREGEYPQDKIKFLKG